MRLWSMHPMYLDTKGLTALWRESLLAQKVLMGETKGYRNHPQLLRFKHADNTLGAIALYLTVIQQEATRRGYKFDDTKINSQRTKKQITVNNKQLEYEISHLSSKLKQRDEARYIDLQRQKQIKTHPLFNVIEGDIEKWEVITP